MRDEVQFPVLDKRGMALLIVLAVVAVLSIAVIGFGRRTHSAMEVAHYFQDQVSLRAMGESGIDLGLSVLHRDRLLGEHDSLLESWNKLETIDLGSLFNQGSLKVKIIDLSGLFPLQRVAAQSQAQSSESEAELFRQMLFRLLTSGDFAVEDESEARIIVDSLTDWVDNDDEPLPFGAENGYYLAQEEPHPARNGPIEFIEELLQVQGMTSEILYGNDEKQGLAEYINIYGNNGININTAPPIVVQALTPDATEAAVEIIDEFRRSDESAPLLEESDWYRSVAGWPRQALIGQGLITTTSNHFQVKATAGNGRRTLTLIADVERDQGDIVINYRSAE